GALLRAGRDEDLHVRVGAHDRADVAAIEDRPLRVHGDGALILKQGPADQRMGGDDRGGGPYAGAAQLGIGEGIAVYAARKVSNSRFVLRINAGGEGVAGNGAV